LSYFADFQLTYARREWSEERAAWRSVILLNFVRNVNLIVDNLTEEMSGILPEIEDDAEDTQPRRNAKALPPLRFKEKHRLLKAHLDCLVKVQTDLESQLGEAANEVVSVGPGGTVAAPFFPGAGSSKQEFSINSTNGWKSALGKFKAMRSSRPDNGDVGPSQRSKDLEEEVLEILASCRDDIKSLWEDPTVHEMLSRRKIRLEDAPGLYVSLSSCPTYSLILTLLVS
jgi:guanine nucleotide-binding protein alpha-1 subunit